MGNPALDLGTCEVCNSKDAIVVRSSSLAAVSFRYCAACFQSGREPRGLAEYILGPSGDYDKLADWVKPIIKVSLDA